MPENDAQKVSTAKNHQDDLKTAFLNAHECFDRLETILMDFFPINRARVTTIKDELWDIRKEYFAQLRDLIQN
ncbi:hypothetical protein AZI87_12020 [Bdellovibrio bacteriovorus]|uniref:Uncharacterized protein n=1 Tax=Bdellovibrio bacteriovorus TaxID=959 RepID=A0A162G8G1_BDEBC|nr:hypothetical protein [Bdellovibrio bacteriovorus]KYG65275.1 hypothetical protein AZI87_12020 [Bdellovibrio bacteriovorus]